MTNSRRSSRAVATSLGVLSVMCAAAIADTVNLSADSQVKSAVGGAVRGSVISESPAEVRVRLGNTTQVVPTSDVVSITYDGRPPSLDLAESRESAGSLAEAADLFKKAATEAASKPFIVESAKFGQAKAVAELAATDPAREDEATKLLEAFTKSYPNGRHIVPALDSLARLQLKQEQYDKVTATLDAMTRLPGSSDRAGVIRARVHAKRGDADRAIIELDTLIGGAAEGSIKRRDALLAKAEVLALGKKFAEAETLVRQVIGSSPPEDFAGQALAHNTLGDCLRSAGKPKDALYAYLHTDLLFNKDKEQHPRALYEIAKLWRILKRDDRAEEAMEKLRQEYPKSQYLRRSE